MKDSRDRVRSAASHWWLPAWCAALTTLVLAPLARPGFLLSYDMVTVPRQRLVPDALGLGSALPRAVPQDAVMALLTSVVPGAVVYRVALIGVIFGGALGAGLLLQRAGSAVQAVAASAYAWNAYVAERLVIGHWSLLIAYAILPWLLRHAVAVRRGERAALRRALLLVALASLTPTGGVLASGVLCVVILMPGTFPAAGFSRVMSVAGCALLQLPWIVPALVSPTSLTSDPTGASAFAARPDSPLGLVGSVLTLGGIWNADVVPESRGLLAAAFLTVAWGALAIAGARDMVSALGEAAARALAGLAVAGVVLGLAGAFGDGLAWAVENVPGAGLLRDGHKFLAWYALALAPAVALGARRITRTVADRWPTISPRVLTVTAVMLPLAALPDLGWGVAGRLEPVAFPREWAVVRDALLSERADGALVVLPYQPFRAFPWNDFRTVLDPLPRYAGIVTVVPDALTVDGHRLAGEDPRAAAVGEALDGPRPIAELLRAGVRWVAVEHETPGEAPRLLLDRLEPIVRNGVLDLYRLPGAPLRWEPLPSPAAVLVIDLVVLAGVVAGITWEVVDRVLRKRRCGWYSPARRRLA